MKKHLLFLFTALTLLLVPTALRADIVTIGDESSGVTAYILPVNMYFNYSLTQQIYTAAEINMSSGGTITAISFEYTSTAAFSLGNIEVYMKNVSKDHFESNTDMVEVTSSDRVFSGTFSASGAGWVTLTLNTPFHYDGTSNLLVCLYDPTEGYPGNTYTFRCTSTGNNSSDPKLAVTYNSDTYIPDLSNIHTYQGGKALQSYRSNIRLTIHPDITDIYITGFTPPIWNGQPTIILNTPTSDPYSVKTSLCIWQDVTNNPANIFTGYVFNKEGHDYALKIYIEADNGYHFANDVTVHINGGTEIVKTQYSDGAYYVAQTIPFHTTRGNNVSIGESTSDVTTNTPYNSVWGYSFVEQVYTADELGVTTGGDISCIRFNMLSADAQTNHITVYMKNVSRSEFSGTSDYEAVTTDDIVYEGNYTFANGWNSIPLTTPFHYNGTDNLMIAVHENTPGYSSRYFYYTEKANSVLSYRSDSNDPDPYDLSSFSGNRSLSQSRADIKIDIHPTTTVNNGTNAKNSVPVYGYWADAYLKAEFVMPADSLTDIPNDSKITSMTFYTTGDALYQNVSWGDAYFKVFLKEVTDATLSDFTGDADATIVYEGALSVVDGKMTVPFPNAYPYHGGNLLVGVYNMVKGSYQALLWRGVAVPGTSVSGYSANSLDEITAAQQDFLPKTTFNYMAPSNFIDFETGTLSQFPFNNTGSYPWIVVSDGYNSAYCMRSGNKGVANSTSTIEATYTFSYDGSISFDANCMGEGTNTLYDVCQFYIDGALQFSHGADLEDWNHYTFNVTAGTHTFKWSYTKDNSVNLAGDGFFVDNIEFTTTTPPDPFVQIGDGTQRSSCLPTSTAEKYSLTEQIYTAEEIGQSGNIYTLAFYTVGNTVTRNLDIYMVHTNKSSFSDATDWVAVNPSDRVFSGNVTMGSEQWTTIELTNPFHYSGTDNLLLVVDDNTGNIDTIDSRFRSFDAPSQSLENYYIGDTDFNPSLPESYSGYVLDVKNQIQLGFEPILCHKPTTLTISNITSNSAELEWTGFGDAYTVQYKPFIFADDFENGIGKWTIYTEGEAPYLDGWFVDWHHHNGSKAACATSNWNSTDYNADNWLVTPQVALSGTLKFWVENMTNVFPESYEVLLSTGGNAISDFTVTLQSMNTPPDEWTEVSIDLSPYAGQLGYIAIHQVGDGQFRLFLDDFTIYDDAQPWQTTTSYTTSTQLSGLTPGTNYLVRVQSECGSGGTSAWSPTLNFATKETCPAPVNLTISNLGPTSVDLSWTDLGDASEWQICVNGDMDNLITATTNPFTLTNLTSVTSYTVKVKTDCGSDGTSFWSSGKIFTTITDQTINSTANWYARAMYSPNGESWVGDYINFSMQDPLTVTVANSDVAPNIYAAAYAEGYMWYIATNNGDLGRATVDNETHTISNFETIVSNFESDLAKSMSYNPIDGNIYYINNSSMLKRFDPAQPNMPIEIGTTSNQLEVFAINSTGEAYGVKYYTGELCHVNLTDASTTIVGPTGHECFSDQDMAFDMETGELFWAQQGSDEALYLVNPETAQTYFLGHIGGGGRFIGMFMVSNATPSCPAPTDLTVSNITENSAELSWTENGTATEWQICVNGNEGSPIDVTENPYTLTGLTPDMSYTVKVRAYCGDAVSDWSTEELFTTMEACPAPTDLTVSNITPNSADLDWTGFGDGYTVKYAPLSTIFSDDFENGLGQWTIYTEGEAPFSDGWFVSDADYHSGSHVACAVSYWGETDQSYAADNWLVTPQVALQGILKFWVKSYSNTWLESYEVLLSTGGNAISDFTVTLQSMHTAPDEWTEVSIDLSSYAGQLGYIAIHHQDDDQLYLLLDDFTIYDMAEPWQTTTTTTADAQLSGLTPETNYEVQVQSDCGSGGTSEWISSNFTTLEACPTPFNLAASSITPNSADLDWTGFGESYTVNYRPLSVVFSDDFENGLGQWTQIDADGDSYIWGLGSVLTGSSYIPHGGLDIVCSQSFDNIYGAFTPDNYLVTPQVTLGGTVSFWVKAQHPHYYAEHFGIAVSTTGNTDAADFTTIAEWTMEAGDWQQFTVDLSDYAGQMGFVALRHFNCTNEWILDIDDFTIYGPNSWQTTTTTTTNVTLSGLTASTTYEVRVQSNCGSDGTSGWSESFIFNNGTCATADQCMITLLLEDSFGDGWGGNAISVVDVLNGQSYGTYTIGDGYSESYTIPVCEGKELAFKWKAGSDANETSWTILNANGEVVTTGTGDEYMSTGDVIYTYTVECSMSTCPAPTNLAVSNITPNSVDLSWTENGTATEWQISVNGDEDNLITVTNNSYEFTGLTPETSYIVKVRANCGSDGVSAWSSVVNFYTNPEIHSTASWYAYALSSSDGESWEGHYINFPLQNPSTVTAATANTTPVIFAAAYANGYMWYINYGDGSLEKAVVDNENHTISNFETIVSGFESDETTTMSYNPVDGQMYYIDINSKLKSFDPTQPTAFTEKGTFSQTIISLAINSEGEAYGVELLTGNLYLVDLTNASTSLVGSTGLEYDYPQDLAFDMETGELFLAQYSSALDNSLYWVNPGTAQTFNIGRIGGGNGGMFTGLFMVGNTTPSCPAPTDLVASNVTKHTAELNWTENGTASEWQMMINHDEENIIDVNGNPYILENLDPYMEYTVQVRANCGSGTVSDWSDEEHFITLVGCQPSNDLSVESVSYNTATLTWSGEGESFNVEYSLLGSGTWETINDVLPPYTITGLAPGSNYEVHVIGNCGTDGLSNWSNTVEFTTPTCPIPSGLTATNVNKHTADLSWTENGSATEWQISLTDGSDIQIITVTSVPSYTLTGLDAYMEYTVMVQSNCEGVWSGWSEMTSFITPVGCEATNDLDVTDETYNSATLTWSGEGETFNLQYQTASGTWVMIENVTSPYTLEGLMSNTDYEVQVQNNCDADGVSDWSNLVTFTTLTCPAPTSLTAANVTKHTADLSWTENGSAEEWQILVTSDEVNTFTVTENPYTLTGLASYMEYTVQVRANCGGTWSDWSNEEHFITPVGCQATNDLAWTAVSQSSATLTWTGEGETFILQYKTDGEEWETIDEVTSPYTLTGLQSNTEYMVQVMNNCDADGVSEWSNTVTFITSSCPTPTGLTVTNITKNSAVLSWTENGTATAWELSIDNYHINPLDIGENPYTLTGLTAGTEYTVKVSAVCGASWSNWSNEVTFTTEVACLPTENLAVTDYTFNTATLNWTGEGNVFQLRHRVSGGEWVETGGIVPPYTLTGLNPGTTYEAQVQNECIGGNLSEWSNLVTFTTSACDPQAIPYAYNFETEEPFYCWSLVTGNIELIQALPSQNHTPNGEYSLAFYESASDVIAFPQFTQEVNTLQVSFWVRPHNNTMSGHGTFSVGYLTDVNDASTFTAVSTYSYDEWPATLDFLRKIVTLQDAPAGAIIAFKHDSPTANGTWYVDDILVSAICDVPTGITVSNITNHGATITWTDNGANSWDVARNNPGNFFHNVTTNEYTFTDLNPGTEHIVKVRSRCGDDILSNWSEQVTFTTLSNSIPTYVNIMGDSTVCYLSTTLLTAHTDVPATYLWSNGATTQQINVGAGTYQVTVTSATGDELASEPFTLTENPNLTGEESRSICPDELPYTWNGHTFPETGMAFVTLTASNGCDSLVKMILSVNPTYNDTIEATSCEGEPYIFAGEFLYESGYYVDSLQTINGCDSVVVLSLTVNPMYAIKAVETICSSELPYEWNGVTFYEEGTEVAQFETVNGCDSLVVMTLYVNPSYSDSIEATICNGEAYNFYGQSLTTSGEYTHSMQTADGCDSVVVLTLTVNPTYSVSEERTVCSGALPYTWNGIIFSGPATKYATLNTVNGCDSVVTMILSVSDVYEITVTQSVCASELPIVWNGKTFNEAGTQTAELEASNGCDSLVTMVLTVNTPVNVATTIGSCGSYTWEANGQTYTESDTYLYEHQDANGCTQVDTLYLTIYNPVHTAITETACGSYTWTGGTGVTYTESGTYYYEHQDAHNCTQVDTLYLTIFTPVNTAITEAACGSYTWTGGTGNTYTESGTYYYEHQDAHNCTQVDTLYLTIFTPTNTAITETACGSYTWTGGTGSTYTESGTYYYEHQDAHNCTQVDTLYLTIFTPTNTAITEAVCGSYTWAANGQTYTESGTYYYEHQDAHSCTQVDTLYLTINNPVNTATTAESCGSYTWAANGQTYTESDTYYYEHQDVNGCTQVDTLYLTIHNPVHTALTVSACGSYTWEANNQTYAVSGEYTYSHQDNHGCTQVDTLHLTILQGSSAVLMNTICASELPYEWNGVTFTEAGMQTATLEAANGCDSVITMVLMVNTPVHHAYTAEACGSYTWVNGNNQTYTTSGDYTYSHQDINGCTQVDTLHLTIFTPAHSSITVAECGSYTWTGGTGVTYTESGNYTYSHQDANGCTQVDTLHLTIFTPIHTAITVAECGSYTWTGGNSQTYTESGNYTYSHQDAHGCTQVDTLHLTIYNPVHTALTVSACGSYTWEANNQAYAVSGDYTYSHQDNHGCTQVDTLHLTILQGSSAVLMNTICASELPYEWNGVTFTEAGMQTATITAANGCDSVVTMVLMVNTPVNTVISASECGSYTWTANGQTYTTSGDYTYSHVDANGCTQVDTLHLTIYNPVHTAVTVSECGDYTWNGQTYTASGDYTYSHLDAHGCTQVDTLHLTIHNPVHTAVTVSECSSYTWAANGQTYTTSGDYTYSHLDANGCTQVDTLHLTIFTPAHSAITVTECGDYTWNGQTYTASGDYTYSHVDANGCTQVDTLHLTIHNPVHTAITVEECDSYTWTDGNNQNYTTSGTYTYEHQDANGCTQVDTLHLTIHQSATSEFTIATQDSCYTWNGQTYCASGDYVQTLETAFGCDSVVTLHLTTSVGVPVHEAEVVFLAPNPTKNISRIMGLETDPVSVDLYDMRGKLVMKASGRELDVTTLPTGLYMVKIYTGDRFINLKLVKQ